MEIEPVIIEPPVSSPTPLVYNDTIDTSNMTNVLLIDSVVYEKQVFYDSANAQTFPIIYDSTAKTEDLLALFRQKFTTSSIERISLVFHDRGPNIQALFMNNKIFFEESDLEVNQTSFSENVSFLISCIKEFHVSHIDYLACNTLQYSNWKSYYALLASQTPVVVGASNDATGNMQYGGDWVMENTSEDVMQIYFNANISNYVSLLATTITQNGGFLYFRMDAGGQFVEYNTGGSTWTTLIISAWPITITNSAPSAGNILRVYLSSDIILTRTYTGNTNSYWIAGSTFITFDGLNRYVRVNGITGYGGFIQNGTFPSARANIVVQNFIMDIIGSSTLADNAGWLCRRSFAFGATLNNSITNCINYANVSGNNAGGIVGSSSGRLNITNCINYGSVSGNYAGGIVGSNSISSNITNCFNIGIVSSNYAGGIVGGYFGFNTSSTCAISGCYSTSEISGSNSGGIVGADVGYNNASFNPVVNITNSYSLGAIATTCGGICGGTDGSVYTNSPTITITNCYSFGAISDVNSGIVSTSYPKPTTITNSYVAAGAWSDASANASLTGNPATNNPGATWGSVSSNIPYILSAYNAQLYTPNSVSTTSNYRTTAGLFQPAFTYGIFQETQVSNVLTTNVFASKGTLPYYYLYNSNNFTLTNTNPNGSTTTMSSSINSLNGILDIIVPAPTGPMTITANGGTQSIYLRMNATQIEYALSLTGPGTLINDYNWPVTIINSTPSSSTILNVIVTEDLTISNTYGNTNGYFIIGTTQIIFDGSYNHININGITGYPGFIQSSKTGVNVQNFITDAIGSLLDPSGGWLLQSNYGFDPLLPFFQGLNNVFRCTNNAVVNGTGLAGANYCGGIAGRNAGGAYSRLEFRDCANTGFIAAWYGGGIAGADAGTSCPGLTFTRCTNTGIIYGSNLDNYYGPGGIVGDSAGKGAVSLTFTDCTNYGVIQASDGGGIAGSNCASSSGTATFTRCVNNGKLDGDSIGAKRSGGIVGYQAAFNGGRITFTDCANNGSIETTNSGGIVGFGACTTNGIVTLSKCFNTGDINTLYAGGIVGASFGFNTDASCNISACYSTGRIFGTGCGGIAGVDIGRSTSAHQINILDCYSLGDIGTTCGGIIGNTETAYSGSVTININITNCYSFGLIFGTGQGIVATSSPANTPPPPIITITNCYIAAGVWSDASANAILTGQPTNISTNNPGTTWTTLQTDTPYVSSAYNAQLYNPNSKSTTSSFRTDPGLFQPDFTYGIFKSTQVTNVLTTSAVAYKGTSPYYYSYNANSYVVTNTNPNGAITTMSSSINSLNGAIEYIIPGPTGPLILQGLVFLRMNGTLMEYASSVTGPWSTIYNYNWPVTISGGIVTFTENLTISNTYGNTNGYFIIISTTTIFDGGNYNLNINNITGYGGFIQNGTQTSNGTQASVQNIRTNVNNSTLSVNSGWICRAYFGRGWPIFNNQTNTISNCTNNGIINANFAGGIAGQYAGLNGVLYFTNCVNNGAVTGQYAGGIVGQYAGQCTQSNTSILLNTITLSFTDCTNNGAISGFAAGGIAGAYVGNGRFPSFPTFLNPIQDRAVSIFTNCTNNGNITGDYGGGIVGQYAGNGNSTKNIPGDIAPYGLTFINCNNTGSINSVGSGGIAGQNAGNDGSVDFQNCTNTGNILVNTNGGGGIVGGYVNRFKLYNCANSGDIIGINSGGIAGQGVYSDSTDIPSYCSNSGAIIGINAGGIVGSRARVNLTNCYNTGIISGQYAGGVVGAFFYPPSFPVVGNNIISCYSTGNITGQQAGGIVGADVGYYSNVSVSIQYSYSLGTISGQQAGGIVGGSTGFPWSNSPIISINNCYSYGTISNGSDGIISPGYYNLSNVNISNCYIANGDWTDASANASLTPGTTPTNLTTNNPGSVWTTLSTTFIPKVPYVLSSFNAQLYSPTSASSASNYSTTPGLIQPNFNYNIVYTTQPANTITTRVFASQGTSPYYYAYNFNQFTFTNISSTSGTIYVAVAPSTGVLNFTIPIINEPIVTQIPNPFTPYAESPNNLGQVIYTDASYVVVPNIATNPTYILSTDVTDNTFDVFQNSAVIPSAFIPNSLFISNNLISPSGIVKDSFGNFYVGNSTYNVISVYDNNGLYLRKISVYSSLNVPLLTISYLAIDDSNNLYVTSNSDTGVFVVPSGNSTNDLDNTILKYIYGNDLLGLTYNANYLYIVKQSIPKYVIKYNIVNNTYLQIPLTLASPALPLTSQPISIVYNSINTSPTLYITTIGGSNNRIYSIANITGTLTSTGGTGSATISSITTFSNNEYPYSITMDNSANLYVGLDEGRIEPVNVSSIGKIARVTPAGTISNTSYLTYNGFGIGRPEGLLFEGSLNLYATDVLHNRVIKSRPKTFVFGPAVLNADAFYVKDPLNPTQYKTYLYDITNSIIATTFNLTADCFQKGTKILCENDIYVPIENIKVGDLVKTYKHGYQKVIRCVNRRSCDYVSNSRNQIYTYTRKSNPELIEDLYLTGGHSLLVDALSETEANDMKQAEWLDADFMVEDKYKLMCCFNKKLEVSANQNVELYRIALEAPENARPTHVYGIWANGILSESSSNASMNK
jgi:hypothetical protein